MIWRILKNKNLPSKMVFKTVAGLKILKNLSRVRDEDRNSSGGIISQGKKPKALLAALFLAFGVLFLFANNTKAAVSQESCTGEGMSWNASAGTCVCSDLNGQRRALNSRGECAFITTTNGGLSGDAYQNDGGNAGAAASLPGAGTKADFYGTEKTETCSLGDFKCYTQLLLFGVFTAVGWLFAIAATLFSWAVDPVNVSGNNGMLNKQAVKDVWVMVRDLLNMSFILVLLFSAFGTIFRQDKWNIKKVWLNILIYALLVNFSYPIARIIIDISNVAFYYLLNNLFVSNSGGAVSGSSILAGFGDSSKIGDLLMPKNFTEYDIAYIIASIVFVFILGMTLLIIAALFIVRLVALTMIIMFSPIGFVGYAVPSMSGYADKWWKNLMNYSFFAPIMIFVMAISLRIMESMANENFQSMVTKASPNSSPVMVQWIASAAFYVIPIIILWTGIGIAKSSGVEFADKVVGKVKGWGKKVANAPWGGIKMGWNATGVPGGFKMTKDYYAKRGVKLPGFKNRHFGSDQTEGTNSWVAQNIGRVPNAYNNNLLKKMGDASKEHNMEDSDSAVLQRIADTGSEAERMAAFEQLAKNGDIKPENLETLIEKFGEKSQIGKRILGKVKESRPDMAFVHIKDDTERANKIKEYVTGDKFDIKKLGSKTLENVEFMTQVVAEGKLDQKAKEALISKKPANAAILNTVTESIANNYISSGKTDMGNAENRNVQMALLAATGKLLITNSDEKKKMFKKLNKDNVSMLDASIIKNNAKELVGSIDNSKLVDIVKSLKTAEAKKALIKTIRDTMLSSGSVEERNNAIQLKAYIRKDPFLQSIV